MVPAGGTTTMTAPVRVLPFVAVIYSETYAASWSLVGLYIISYLHQKNSRFVGLGVTNSITIKCKICQKSLTLSQCCRDEMDLYPQPWSHHEKGSKNMLLGLKKAPKEITYSNINETNAVYLFSTFVMGLGIL